MIEVKITGPHGLSDPKFAAQDSTGKIWYKAKRKSDVKTSVKRSKHDLTLVEEFTSSTKPKTKKKIEKKKVNSYENYRDYILGLPLNTILTINSPAVPVFCYKFGLKLSKIKHNLTWVKTLENMEKEGYLVYRNKQTGKYKKLVFDWHPDIKNNMEEL